MYAEASLLLPFLQGFSSQEAHHFHLPDDEELLCHFHTNIPNETHLLGNLLQTSTISEYDLGGEGDLFKAPEPIIEEPMLPLDPMTAAMSMISGGEDFITAETAKVTDMDTIQNELLSEVFYECKKDILAKSAFEESFSDLSDVKIPAVQMEADPVAERNRVVGEGLIQKSVSSGCLTSMESINGCTMRPNFLDFQMDFGAAFRIRRAYSEGDIQTLGNNNNTLSNTSIAHSSFERQLTVGDDKIEDRRQKLSRYRNKKTKRNFDRKIKYACRKALADSQPRVRGRFAKTEECEFAKPHK